MNPMIPDLPEDLDIPNPTVVGPSIPEEMYPEHASNDPARQPQNSALIVPVDETLLLDTDQFSNRLGSVMDLQAIAIDAVKTAMSQAMAQDPSIALAFFKETTNASVKMVDMARRLSETRAKTNALLAASGRVPAPRPAAQTAPARTVPEHEDKPVAEANKIAPEPAPAVSGPVTEPGDLSTSRFSGLDVVPTL